MSVLVLPEKAQMRERLWTQAIYAGLSKVHLIEPDYKFDVNVLRSQTVERVTKPNIFDKLERACEEYKMANDVIYMERDLR